MRRPRPRLLTVLALTGALTISALPGLPGATAKEGGSAIDIHADVTLPEFPCIAEAGQERCAGTLSGEVTGSFSGDHDGLRWSFAIAEATLTTIDPTFSYGDHGANPCLNGTASGALHVTADGAHTFGAYEFEEPAKAPRPVDGLDMTVDFTWERVGTKVEVELHDAVVLANVGGLGWLELISAGQGGGDGTLTLNLDTSDLPDCVFLDDTPAVTGSLDAAGAFTEDRPPSIPTLITPDPDPENPPTFTFGQPTKFTVNATDPDNDPYTARITVADAVTGQVVEEFESHLAPSGVDATGRPDDPLPPGDYSWAALAVDVRGAAGPQSATGFFNVVPAGTLGGLDPLPDL